MSLTEQLKVPRSLHPAAWWLWAALVAGVCTRTDNVPALACLCFITAVVAFQRQFSASHWRTFQLLIVMASGIVILRLLLQVLFGAPVGADVLFRLPVLHLPDWLSGIRIGGVVTQTSLLTALVEAARIVATISVLATAACVTSTTRLLRSLPASFHTFGMLVIISVTFIPNIFHDVSRIQSAHRWRGSRKGRIRTLSTNLVSVCSTALDRSVVLAGSMTTRGYSTSGVAHRNVNRGLLLLALSLGLWLAAPRWAIAAAICAIAGCTVLLMHIVETEQQSTRTRYRVESWQAPEIALILSAGVVIALWNISVSAALIALTMPLVITPQLPAIRMAAA